MVLQQDVPKTIGRYQVVEKLAAGSLAELFLGRFVAPGGFEKRCAIKRLRPELAGDEALTQALLTEAKGAARLDHPNVVQIFELGRDAAGQLFVAMELVEGLDLHRLLTLSTRYGARIPVELALWLTTQVLEGLAYAHALDDGRGKPLGLIHRDVTPRNVLCAWNGAVKIVDFGFGNAFPGPGHNDLLKRKLPYMSPEQASGAPIDARSDLFSVAIGLYELLAGSRPFDGTPPVLLRALRENPPPPLALRRPETPKEVVEAIERALAKRPRDRFAGASTFRAALQAILDTAEAPVDRHSMAAYLEALRDGHPERYQGSRIRPSGPAAQAPVALARIRTVQRPSDDPPPAGPPLGVPLLPAPALLANHEPLAGSKEERYRAPPQGVEETGENDEVPAPSSAYPAIVAIMTAVAVVAGGLGWATLAGAPKTAFRSQSPAAAVKTPSGPPDRPRPSGALASVDRKQPPSAAAGPAPAESRASSQRLDRASFGAESAAAPERQSTAPGAPEPTKMSDPVVQPATGPTPRPEQTPSGPSGPSAPSLTARPDQRSVVARAPEPTATTTPVPEPPASLDAMPERRAEPEPVAEGVPKLSGGDAPSGAGPGSALSELGSRPAGTAPDDALLADEPLAFFGVLILRSTPRGLVARVDGRRVGRTPLQLELPAGTYRLELEDRRRGIRRKLRRDISAGAEVKESFVFRKGELRILSRPWARVLVNGKEEGVTPLVLSVYEGRHRVELRYPSGESKTFEARVRPGQRETLKSKL